MYVSTDVYVNMHILSALENEPILICVRVCVNIYRS